MERLAAALGRVALHGRERLRGEQSGRPAHRGADGGDRAGQAHAVAAERARVRGHGGVDVVARRLVCHPRVALTSADAAVRDGRVRD